MKYCEYCGEELERGILEWREIEEIIDYTIAERGENGSPKERGAMIAYFKSLLDDGLAFGTDRQVLDYCHALWSVMSRFKDRGLIQTELNFKLWLDV